VTDPISSVANPRVKALARLHGARERRRTGLFLIEGDRELARAVESGVTLTSVVSCTAMLGPAARRLLAALPGGVERIELAPEPFRKLAYRKNPRGIIGVAAQPELGLARIEVGADPLVLIAEAIEKPGNLGALLRSADAAGATAVVVADPTVDVFNPNVVRASQGALFTVPVAVATSAAVLDWAAGESIELFAGIPGATESLWSADFTGRVGLVVGREDRGLSTAWQQAATPVAIPMAGCGDSLNTATAAAVLLFEAVRQRRRPG
jgi:TrmH family RNA methyltransferase